MSWKCLLCGHTGEEESASESLPCCSWCQTEAAELTLQEISALKKLEQIKPAFQIWSQARREDSAENMKSHSLPEPQPARVFPGLSLYVGDMDDAADVDKLKGMEVGCVVNLCADKISHAYEKVPMQLARARIQQHILIADDARGFDIMEVAQQVFATIDATLRAEKGVLIHCWGGVNRSAAVAIAFLTLHLKIPLFAAVSYAMRTRGTILTNQSFRKQLVRHCFKAGVDLEGSNVPSELLKEPEDLQANEVCLGCSDPNGRHRPEPPKDTAVYGLLFAARDGCLKCVKQYIEEDGVDPKSQSDTRCYTAEDWARWQLQRLHKRQERMRYQAVLAYLTGAKKSDADCMSPT